MEDVREADLRGEGERGGFQQAKGTILEVLGVGAQGETDAAGFCNGPKSLHV